MPTIQLHGDGQDGNRVLSRMYFPDDEVKYEQLVEDLASLSYALEGVGQGTDASAKIPNTPAEHRTTMRLFETGWRGSLAGDILLAVAAMRAAEIDEPSVRKAIYVVHERGTALLGEIRGDEPKGREDKGLGLTEKSLWNYHREFKSVCHFWAAHRILETTTPFLDVPSVLADRVALNLFLGHAEWFLHLGCDQASRNTKKQSLLDRTNAWSVAPAATAIKPDLEVVATLVAEEVQGYVPAKYPEQ